MNIVNALAVSIGALSFAATYLSLGTGLGVQVWALFIGWGAFYHCGGKLAGLKAAVVNAAWGAAVATVALVVVGKVGGSVAVSSALVALSVVALVLGAHLPAFAVIPAAVYGYASTAGFALLSGVAIGEPAAMARAAVTVLLSLAVGAVFGVVSEGLAGKMTKAAE